MLLMVAAEPGLPGGVHGVCITSDMVLSVSLRCFAFLSQYRCKHSNTLPTITNVPLPAPTPMYTNSEVAAELLLDASS